MANQGDTKPGAGTLVSVEGPGYTGYTQANPSVAVGPGAVLLTMKVSKCPKLQNFVAFCRDYLQTCSLCSCHYHDQASQQCAVGSCHTSLLYSTTD